MSTAGMAELDAMIARVRSLRGLATRAAPDVAAAIEAELHATIAAGTTPGGTAWQLTRDGRTPLTGAAKALGVAAVGSTIYVRLTGVEARHHLGRARAGIERQVIPRELSPRMAAAVHDVLARHFAEAVSDGGAHG